MGIFNDQAHATADFTVTADATHPIFVANGTVNVESVRATFQANIATSATDYATFGCDNLGTDGTGTTVVAGTNNFDEATNGGAAITALVPVTMDVVAAAKQLTDGEVLGFNWNEATTDVADATIHVDVRYTQLTSPDQA